MPKGGDAIPRPTSFDCVCFPKARWHVTPDVVRPCLPSMGYYGMPRQMSFDHVCFPKAIMACHARRRSTVCAVQRRLCHATPDVVRPCVLPKGGDVMPCPMSSDHACCPRAEMSCHAQSCRPCVLSKGGDVMPRPMSSDRACSSRAVM